MNTWQIILRTFVTKNSSNIPLTCQFIDSSSQLPPFNPQKELYPPDQDCHVSIHYNIVVTNC